MPYINPKDRPEYDKGLDQIPDILTKGDLEYCIFKLMRKFMATRDMRYTQLHDATYAAAHCCDEFRRRFLDKREDEAMARNGDVEA